MERGVHFDGRVVVGGTDEPGGWELRGADDLSAGKVMPAAAAAAAAAAVAAAARGGF